MSNTLAALIVESARRVGWYASGAPSAAGTTTSWVMNAVGAGFDEMDPDTTYRDAYAKVEADSAGTPQNVGEVRRIKAYTSATSTFTLPSGRGFSNAMTTTMTVGLYKTVPPTQWGGQLGWTQYINRTLRALRFRRYGLLSLVTDGDMETSGTTNWTASNSTLAKVTTAANITLGAQSLSATNSSANGYARSALLPVAPGEFYYLRADCQVSSGTAVLEAYDETNAASVDSKSTTYRDWRYLAFPFTVPSGCLSLSIRLKGTEATAVVYWDNVSLRNSRARRIALPSWVDRRAAFEWLYEYRGATALSDAYLEVGQGPVPLPHADVREDPTGATALHAEYGFQPRSDSLLLVRGLSAYGELSADTSTTVADLDLIASGACLYALRELRDPRAPEFLAEFQGRATQLPRREVPIGRAV